MIPRCTVRMWKSFVTLVTTVCHSSIPSARWMQTIPFHPISLRSILILSSHLHPGIHSGLFPSRFPIKTLHTFLFHPTRYFHVRIGILLSSTHNTCLSIYTYLVMFILSQLAHYILKDWTVCILTGLKNFHFSHLQSYVKSFWSVHKDQQIYDCITTDFQL